MACFYLYLLILITDLNPVADIVDMISLILMFIFVVTFLANLLYALGSFAVSIIAGVKRVIKKYREKDEVKGEHGLGVK